MWQYLPQATGQPRARRRQISVLPCSTILGSHQASTASQSGHQSLAAQDYLIGFQDAQSPVANHALIKRAGWHGAALIADLWQDLLSAASLLNHPQGQRCEYPLPQPSSASPRHRRHQHSSPAPHRADRQYLSLYPQYRRQGPSSPLRGRRRPLVTRPGLITRSQQGGCGQNQHG